MYKALRPLLFALNAEHAHHLTVAATATAGKLGVLRRVLPARVTDPVELLGLRFANRVGLAAGLDKDGRCILGMQALGFGFLEIGTVTPLAQPGNPKPRLFRLAQHQAIINRMGFNNQGLHSLLGRLQELRSAEPHKCSAGSPKSSAGLQGGDGLKISSELQVPLGINLGKNKLTPPERAIDDYLQGLNAVYPYADYVTINLSSPNTPGLRDMQFGEPLDALLSALQVRRANLADQFGYRRPVLVKLAPDMSDQDLLEVSDRLVHFGMDGVIATNTTIDRARVAGDRHAGEAGGLSGAVLFERSTAVVATLASHLDGALVIVGVGGINSADDAVAKIDAGADLVQLYTGLIYQGPRLVRDCALAIQSANRLG